jgi:hypothetical protein
MVEGAVELSCAVSATLREGRGGECQLYPEVKGNV